MVKRTILASMAILLIFSNPSLAEDEFDFYLHASESNILLNLEENVTVTIFVNLTKGIPTNVTLDGRWTGEVPEAKVNITPSKGMVPFTAKIFFSAFHKTGKFIYMIKCSGGGVVHYLNLTLFVTDLNIDFSINKCSFSKGEEIHISGEVSQDYVEEVNLNISCGDWYRSLDLPVKNRSFEFWYNISFGDPDGRWSVKISSMDRRGILVEKEKDINVSNPPDVVRYKVIFLSPPKGAVYFRGETIDICAFVSDAGKGVKGASTNCVLPSLSRINLTETKAGYYRASYTIPWNCKTGKWFLSVESINGSFAGGRSTYIFVKPAKLKIEIVEPSGKISGETDILVSLHYPDGSIVKDASVKVISANGCTWLSYAGNGTYKGSLEPGNGEKYMKIEVYAVDAYGNSASLSKIFYVVHGKTYRFDFLSTSIISLISILALVSIYWARRVYSIRHLQDIQRELNEVRRLQKETVIRYYREGSISRKTYDALMQEYTKIHDKLMNEYAELLAKMKKGKKAYRGIAKGGLSG